MKRPKIKKFTARDEQPKSRRKRHKEKVDNFQVQLNLLKDQIDSLKQDIRPMMLEREALNESKDRLLISCDASWKKVDDRAYATIAFIMRSVALPEPHRVCMPSNALTSNESELDALYSALDTLQGMHMHTLKNTKIKFIELRSDSQLCINWITGKRNCYIQKIKNKLAVIRDTIKGIESLSGKSIKLVWRKRNSTHDLQAANNLVQEANGVKLH